MSKYQSYRTISDAEFQALTRNNVSSEPFLVVFTANWLGEGAIVDSILSKLAEQYEGRTRFFRLDVDESPQTALRLGIHHLPTILFFKNGELADRCLGMMPRKKLVQKVEGLLARGVLEGART